MLKKPEDMASKHIKREAVLEAAIAEFAAKGYDSASTNSIAGSAGVSKGIIFHYFGSKKDLFLAAVDCAHSRFMTEYEKAVRYLPSDPIDHLIERLKAKKKIAMNLATETELLRRAWMPVPKGLEKEMKQRAQKVADIQNDHLWSHADFGKLKPDVDPKIAKMLIESCVEGLMRRYSLRMMELGKDWPAGLDAWSADIRKCLNMLKTALYEAAEE